MFGGEDKRKGTSVISGGTGGPERVAATMGLLSGPYLGLLDFAAIVIENSWPGRAANRWEVRGGNTIIFSTA